MAALDTSTGALLWSYATGGMVGSSPALSAAGTELFVGCEDGYLYSLAIPPREPARADGP